MSVSNKFCTYCKNELDTMGKSIPPRTISGYLIPLLNTEFILRYSNINGLKDDRILLFKYTSGLLKNKYILPGGFAIYNKSAEDSCLHYLSKTFKTEKINSNDFSFLFYNVYGDPLRHPQYHLISSVFETKFSHEISDICFDFTKEIEVNYETVVLDSISLSKFQDENVIEDFKSLFALDYYDIIKNYVSKI